MREERVTTWNQLMNCLYEDAWSATIQRFRPPFAFRGMADADFTLNTSLMRLENGYEHSERHLLRNFKKYASRSSMEDTTLVIITRNRIDTRLYTLTN